jgi:N-acyl homoserine lactone hydrolase
VGLIRLYVIPAGTLRIDKGAVFTPGIDDGVLIEVPVPVYLVRTDEDENVLVDTGMHPAHIDDPFYSFGLENADTVEAWMQPEDRLEARLAEVGLDLADITHVVNTHLHPDHCGGNFLFPDAEIIVQREHYEEALGHPEIPDELFHRSELHYRLLDGDAQLFGGVRAIVAPGHARGLQALLVSLPHSGSILIAGDAVDTAEHLERDLWTLRNGLEASTSVNSNVTTPVGRSRTIAHDHAAATLCCPAGTRRRLRERRSAALIDNISWPTRGPNVD